MDVTSILQLLLPSFVLCTLMVGMLSYLGIHVIARQIIFVDLALAQIAALGALVGLVLGIPLHSVGSDMYSLAMTVIAAAMFSIFRMRESRVPQEALIGLTYAIAAGTTIIIIDKAPHGAEHIKDILTGSILWVKWNTVGKVAAVYAVVGFFHVLFHRRFLLISHDVHKAEAQGIHVRVWDFLFYLLFGIVITVTVGTAGVLLVFVFLVAPAVMAVLVSNRLKRQLLVGWTVGIVSTVCGLLASYLGDLSSGPVVIGAYAVALVAVSTTVHVVRAPNRAAAARTAAVTTAVFVLAFLSLILVGRWMGHGHAHPEHHHLPAATETATAPDPARDVERILATLRDDPQAGAVLAIQFLEADPPPFHAQKVLEGLDLKLATPSGYDVTRPADSPDNQAALDRIRTALGLGG